MSSSDWPNEVAGKRSMITHIKMMSSLIPMKTAVQYKTDDTNKTHVTFKVKQNMQQFVSKF